MGLGGRPLIYMKDGILFHNQDVARVVLRPKCISVGCTDITPEALEHLLAKWKERYGDVIPEEVVLQEGKIELT